MTCRKVAEYNGRAGRQRLVGQTPSGPVFAPFRTEAECNQACQEGACCEGTTCSVKPACQCQGTGKTFKGVGTVCTPNPCSGAVGTVSASGGLLVDLQSVAPLQISGGGSYGLAARGGSITVSFNPLP